MWKIDLDEEEDKQKDQFGGCCRNAGGGGVMMAWTGAGHERGKKLLSDSGHDLSEPARIADRPDTKLEEKRGIRLTANFWCEQLGEGWVQFTEMRMGGQAELESQEYCFGYIKLELPLEQRSQIDSSR